MSLSSSLETIPDSQEYEKIIPPPKMCSNIQYHSLHEGTILYVHVL